MGEWFEAEDKEVFNDFNALVLRQEELAINRWNQDEYYKCVVDGYPWATLFHDTDKDVYTFELPYGVSQLSIQPVPNKNLELVNETSEQLLVDFPEADAEPIDDSEEAENAAQAADRFLSQDSGEQGTNDAVLFDDRVKLSLTTASSFIEYWIDPAGGGYVPLQIEAHPAAESPDNPLVGPDGMPTTDNILRYVTAPEGGEFTDDPTLAAPQWQPKVRAAKWGREHIRTFPESKPVDQAEKVLILGYCTLGEAKRRWESIAAMAPEDLTALCDWTPMRYLALLPPYQRARWKLTDGKLKNKGGSSDERIMFYYHTYVKACPDYPKGADIVVSGIDGGFVIDKKLLSVEVEVSKGQADRVKETRCREIPVVQVTPRGDPYGQDPTGKCYLSLFVGATEWNAMLSQSYASGIDQVLTQPYASSSLSPIEGWQVEQARRSKDILRVISKDDLPQQLQPPVLPTSFFNMYEVSDEAIDRIAHRTKAATGAENSKERSGKALQIAVSQNNVGNQSMLTAVNNAYARACRIKLELMMAECTTAQQVAYVGEDGANKLMDLHAMDFALIGKVGIKAGTGTGLTQDGKVQYLGNLAAEQFITLEEAREAARPSFSKRLGLPANPHEQYVSRAIDSWLDGPPQLNADPASQVPQLDAMGQPVPQPTWQEQYRAWMEAEQQFEAAEAAFQQQQQAHTQFLTNAAVVSAGPPAPTSGPEGQNQKSGVDFEQARIGMAVQEAQNPGVSQAPVAPMKPQVPKPWTPFEPRPNDTEPEVAAIWNRRLSRTMSSVKYAEYRDTEPEWTDVFNRQYNLTRQAKAVAQGASPPAQGAKRPTRTPQTSPTEPSQPTQPTPNLPAGA